MNSFLSFYRNNRIAFSISTFGLSGLFASWMVSIEKMRLIENPNLTTLCDINPWVSCGRVMKSVYSTQIMFGYPNSWLGLMLYPCAVWLGLYLMFAKDHNKAFLKFCNFLPFLAFCLSLYWIVIQAYVLRAICMWCMISMISSTCIFFLITKYNILLDNAPLPFLAKLKKPLQKDWDVPGIIAWFVLIFLFMAIPFWLGL